MWHGIDANEMKTVWGDALGGFTPLQIRDALNRCLCEPRPPNLPQFISWCRTYAHNEVKQIELAPVDKERARQFMAEIKQRFFNKGAEA